MSLNKTLAVGAIYDYPLTDQTKSWRNTVASVSDAGAYVVDQLMVKTLALIGTVRKNPDTMYEFAKDAVVDALDYISQLEQQVADLRQQLAGRTP